MPVYPSGGTIAQSVGSPGFGPAPAPSYTSPGSVRFNPADTPSFGYVPALTGNRSTWTWAGWVKRSLLGSIQTLLGVNTDTNNHIFIEFQANDTIRIASNTAASTVIQLITTQVFRDPSQWYNLVIVFDLTNATQADRVRLFINGVRVTAFSTSTIPANTTTITSVNQAGVQHYLGRYAASSLYYFGGYMAEVYLIDGQALSPSSFTETSSTTGQLVPITTGYTGAYGTNGFYLPFSSNALAVDLGQNKKVTGQDGYWPYNTLLVDTTSTNGQQNNTFLDSSTNNFTITRNGNTTQGNFTPFTFGGGTTQANGYYSGYFDGNGDFLTVPNNAALNLSSGDFTIEGWYYCTSLTAGTQQIINKDGVFNASYPSYSVVINSSGVLLLNLGNGAGLSPTVTTYTGVAISTNTWNHFACVKLGTTIKIFQNGVQTVSTSQGLAITDGGKPLYIAYYNGGASDDYFRGYLSNIRIVKGTAVYTANFTVPTTPLTAVTNTQLLTCQSSQFIDNSTNAFAITVNGNTQPTPANPFGMTAWSGYFDGAGDYLSIPKNVALASPGDFTFEAWIYPTSTNTGTLCGFGANQPTGYCGLNWRITSTTMQTYWSTNGTTETLIAGGAVVQNVWQHVAATRSGTTIRIFLNGIQAGTGTVSGALYTGSASTGGANSYTIGSYFSSNVAGVFFTGCISNFRYINGTALYTSNFTPPTAPLTAITNTQLLTCQSSTFVDNSPNAFTITPFGNSYMGTLNNPFNSPVNYTTPPAQAWSNYFDGSGDYITYPSTTAFTFGTGNFTIECWFNASATASLGTIVTTGEPTDNQGFLLSVFNGFTYTLLGNGSSWNTQLTGTIPVKIGQWNHLAVTRSGSSVQVFLNGSLDIAGTNSTSLTNSNNRITIGGRSNGSQWFTGYISNLRIQKGIAQYTQPFTPPTAPLSVNNGCVLLTCQSNRFVDNSLNNLSASVFGNSLISPLSPFIPTTAWTAASNGGSMYFDGGGDFLSLPSSSQLSMGTGDFTWELWINQQSSTNYRTFIDTRTGSGNLGLYFGTNTGTTNLYVSNDTTALIISSVSFNLNAWNHVALVRFSNTLTVYLNGAPVGSASYSTNMTNTTGTIGAGIFANPYVGYMSGLRILKGTALYTTPFVPPVLPPTNISNTSLLLNATNSGIYDATGQNVIETVGNAQVSTAVKKFGESSMSFDGSGDILIIQPTERMVFGTADFTVETWVYPTATQAQFATIVSNASTPNGWYLAFSTSNLVYFSNQATVAITSSTSLSNNVWTHVAVSRIGTTMRMFFNGVQVASATNSTTYGVSTAVTYVASNGSTNYFLGYLQDLRVTRGLGRYSGAFTPPAAAFAYNVQDVGFQQWTPTNISVTAGVDNDSLTDTVSDSGTDTGVGGQVRGNYATLNPLRGTTGTLSNGNLQYTGIVGDATRAATIGVSSGKWYAEFNVNSALGATVTMGIAVYDQNAAGTSNASQSRGYFYTGQKYSNGSLAAYGNSFTNGDIIGVALDLDAGKVWFSKNGVFQASGDPVAGTNAAYTDLGTTSTWFVSVQSGGSAGSSASAFLNAGQRAFAYTAPSGFKCLVSTNLPVTNGIGASASTQASDYFNTILWTGDSTSSRALTGVGFQPDIVWIKTRSTTYDHNVFDVVRGTGNTKVLTPNATYQEGYQGSTFTYGAVSAFNADGFTVVPGTSPTNALNQSGQTFVSWNWKANGAGVANTAGTIPSTVSANTTSGCSVLTYTGNGISGATIGHGLGVAPSFYIVKNRGSAAKDWECYHISLGNTNRIRLNVASIADTGGTMWANTSPTSTVFSVGTDADVNASANTYVAYCFAPINGFSAFGSYTGNGSATLGPFIYTGFRPAYVLIKRSAGGAADWVVFDDARNTSNLTTQILIPNTAGAEVTGVGTVLDLVSNGFLPRNAGTEVNASGSTYIYAAFAEFPFKYSRAR
jgi:hypothetical protein